MAASSYLEPMQGAADPPGWDATWRAAAAAADPAGRFTPVRISAEHRGAYHALAGRQATVELRGRHYRSAADKRDLPAVGDFCLVDGWEAACGGAGSATIEAVLPRRSLLVRRAAGLAVAPQPLAANVDVALIVTSANSDWSTQRLDRYLELVRDGGITAIVVVSKLDLAPNAQEVLAAVAAAAPGAAVIGTSAPTGLGLDAVQAAVGAGKTGILLGSSGVGKSSILNALNALSGRGAGDAGGDLRGDISGDAGDLSADGAPPVIAVVAQRTGAIRDDERGRHTTTVRQLFTVPDGSIWIDTPGMRELAAFAEGDPESAFTDIAELAQTCRFTDCGHGREPGCTVAAAIKSGQLSAHRLASYHKLRDERQRDVTRRAAAAALAESRAKQRARSRGARKPSSRG
jgi:ribosome biogenesis GTPase / thiamine phosphate phosphatase